MSKPDQIQLCGNTATHEAHFEMLNVYDDDGAFIAEEYFRCPGFDPEAVNSVEKILEKVKSLTDEQLDRILPSGDVTPETHTLELNFSDEDQKELNKFFFDNQEAAERAAAEREILEYLEKPAVDPFEGILAKDPDLQAKMDAYSAQAERLQHQEYLKRLREAAEKGDIKQYPNRAERRANAKANRKAQR